MKALTYFSPGHVEVVDMPSPEPREGDVLVEVMACGICATDIKTYLRGHPKIPTGTVLGHEVVGSVIDTGTSDRFAPGELVVLAPYAPCGECAECRRGLFTLCSQLWARAPEPGGFAEIVRIPGGAVDETVARWPDARPVLAGTLAEPLACSLHALERAAVGPDTSLVIIGDGPMGLIQAAAARTLGARAVVLAGLLPERLEVARTLADFVVDIGREELEPAVKGHLGDGADVVFVSVASEQAVEDAQRVVRKGGVLELFAGMSSGTRLSIDAQLIHYEGVRLQGSFGFAPPHFQRAVELLGRPEFPAERLITNTTSMAALPEALDQAANHTGIKTVMVSDYGRARGVSNHGI